MNQIFKNIAMTAIFIATTVFTSCNTNDDNAIANKANTAKPIVQAAATPPILTVSNTTPFYVTLSLIAAQTQAVPDPQTRMFYKSGAGTSLGFPVIGPGQTVKFYSYNSAAPSSYAVPSWAVSNYVTPALSGFNIPSNTVQSTYNIAYWAGLYISASSAPTGVFFTNVAASAGTSSDLRFIGQTSYGDFNPTLSGSFRTPYNIIKFNLGTATQATAKWTADPNSSNPNDVLVIIQ
jgi:hypothetical protein